MPWRLSDSEGLRAVQICYVAHTPRHCCWNFTRQFQRFQMQCLMQCLGRAPVVKQKNFDSVNQPLLVSGGLLPKIITWMGVAPQVFMFQKHPEPWDFPASSRKCPSLWPKCITCDRTSGNSRAISSLDGWFSVSRLHYPRVNAFTMIPSLDRLAGPIANHK